MRTIQVIALSFALFLVIASIGCGNTYCCELPDGSCISVKHGADGSKQCAEKGGTPFTDKTCQSGKCVAIPEEKLGCCQIEGNCFRSTKRGCISGVWSSLWVCDEGRCVKPEG